MNRLNTGEYSVYTCPDSTKKSQAVREGSLSVKGWQVTFSIRRKVAAAAAVLPITRCNFDLIFVVNWSAQCATMQHRTTASFIYSRGV